MKVSLQEIDLPILSEHKVSLFLKREDLLHPQISGNKYRKLKYNIESAKQQGYKTLLTFGGAYSNHIAATAYAGKAHGLNTIGVIRGKEIAKKWQENPTLKLASENGMQFHFVSREAYQDKNNQEFLETLKSKFRTFYLLPEGGTNALAVKGCEEILDATTAHFNYVCAAVGTGGTLAGIINASHENQTVLGFPALKGDFLNQDIRNFTTKENWQLQNSYHFGGYAKVTRELILFINEFKQETQISLDPIYTGKMIFGILDMIKTNQFKPNTSILAIHTGGLQGIKGMNNRLKKKNLPLLEV